MLCKSREVQIWQLRDLYDRKLRLRVVRSLPHDRDAGILCRLPRESKWYMRKVAGKVPGFHPVHNEGDQGWAASATTDAQFHVHNTTTVAGASATSTAADTTGAAATSNRDTVGPRWTVEHFR